MGKCNESELQLIALRRIENLKYIFLHEECGIVDMPINYELMVCKNLFHIRFMVYYGGAFHESLNFLRHYF